METKSQKNTGMAVVAYILFFIPLLTEAKDDSFVKFHVKQSLVLLIVSIAINAVLYAVPMIIGRGMIQSLGSLFTLILFVMGIMHAINGEEKELPIIGKYASNFKF